MLFRWPPLALLLAVPALVCAQIPASNHVVIVMEENHGYASVVGNSAMPYFNSLAKTYAMATQYYADAHSSIPNYLMLTSGQILATNDGTTATFSNDNLVRRLIAAGKTWKSYAESLPSVGYLGPNVYPYVRRHNPFVYYTDVVNSSAQQQNVVPFTQFAIDLANNQLPDFSYIAPNLQNDAHDCPAGMTTCTDSQKLANADLWLSVNLPPLLNSPSFQPGGDGLLLILWDEASKTDTTNGGGKVAALVIGPNVLPGVRPSALYQHEHALRLILDSLGLPDNLAAATLATNIAEFFSSLPPLLPPVSVSPTSAFFGYLVAGNTSAAHSFTLTNNQATSLSITGVRPNGDFAASSSCPASLGPAASCTISATFSPSAIGTLRGNITITNDAASSPQVIYLAGAGNNAGPNPIPPPLISSISPSSGPDTGGTSVLVSGANLASGASVSFGGVSAVSVSVNSATSLTAVSPAQADGPVAITVANPDGQDASSTNWLLNPGFELGASDWKFTGSGGYSIQNQTGAAHSGVNYAVLSSPVGDHPVLNVTDASGNIAYFSVTPGQIINFSDWAYRVSGDGNAHVMLVLYDSSKANPTFVSTSPSNVAGASWTLQQNSYTVPAGKAYARLYAEISGNTASALVRFDDVSLSIGSSGAFTFLPPASPREGQ